MKKVNIEKFLADYENAIREKDEIIANKDAEFNAEKEKAENVMINNNYPETIKNKLIDLVLEELETKFSTAEIDQKIANFEIYLDDIVDENIENTENENIELGDVPENLNDNQNI